MEALEHKADVLITDIGQSIIGKVLQVITVQQIGAGGWHIQTADQIHQCGLTAAGGTHDCQVFPFFHG